VGLQGAELKIFFKKNGPTMQNNNAATFGKQTLNIAD